jgi:SWI/SNF-related matrix-associated actin-dependent regulator 1 of chromatin subfamily A
MKQITPDNKKLFPFQEAGVEFLAARNSALLADEQGLGKSVQAIAAYNKLGLSTALIVCPASVKWNWESELRAWLTDYHTIQVLESSKAVVDPDAEIVVVNYDLLTYGLTYNPDGSIKGGGIYDQLVKRSWDVVIMDEAHYMKSHDAIRTKAMLQSRRIASRGMYKWFMTGTPILNRPIELWPILKAAAPSVIEPYTTRLEFGKRYCGAWWDGLMWNMDGHSHESELNERLRKTFMMRRLKAEVLTELPERTFQIIPFHADKKYSQVLEQERQALEDIKTGKVNLNLGGMPIALHRREVAEAKVMQAIAFIQEELESVNKIVVFAHHRNVITNLAHNLAAYSPVVTSGDTAGITRQANVKKFQTEKDCRIFIGQIQAAGTGITLTAASRVIFVESSWVPGEILQAVDRVHRIGQKDAVLAQFLVLAGTVEEYMLRTAVEKMKVIKDIVDKPESAEGQTSTKGGSTNVD